MVFQKSGGQIFLQVLTGYQKLKLFIFGGFKMKNFKEMVYGNLFEAKKKGKYDDDDGKGEKCDYVPCKDRLKEEKEIATDEEIKKVVIDILDEEGGASGLDPIKVAVEKLNLPENFNLEEFLDSLPDDEIKRHQEKDYIEMTGLKEESATT